MKNFPFPYKFQTPKLGKGAMQTSWVFFFIMHVLTNTGMIQEKHKYMNCDC